MPFRDLVVFGVVFTIVPLALRSPWIGVMGWTWLSLMNPHRQAWGPAFDFQFAQLVAGATLLGLVFTREPRKFKSEPEVWLLIVLLIWMSVTTITALEAIAAQEMWIRVLKIQVMTFVALLVLHSRRHIDTLVAVCVLSIGYYSVKGGLFTILTGGAHRVYGPADSFIADNNTMALATIMTIPLMVYLAQRVEKRWMRVAIGAAAVLSCASALGSHSRGALLAIAAMSGFLWLRSPQKLGYGAAIVLVAIAFVPFMPEQWFTRMGTITEYESDGSALGRINAWRTALNIANARLLGGGFEFYSFATFAVYAPDPNDLKSAHSIYFQVLGEHGWIGLLLFLGMWLSVWRTCQRIRRDTIERAELKWAGQLASMIQVSLVGYAVGGTFLNLAYFDLPYYELILVVVTRWHIDHAAMPMKKASTAGTSALQQFAAGHPKI